MIMKTVYIDTNVYIDYFLNRTDKLRPLGDFAFNLIKKIVIEEYKLIISDLVILELEHNGFEKQVKILLEKLKENNNLTFVTSIEEDNVKTNKIVKERKTSFNDTKHAIMANRAKADYFVTRNVKDFEDLNDIVYPIYPENL